MQLFRKGQQLRGRTAILHALADQNDRPFGIQQHIDGLCHPVRIRPAATGNIGVPFFRPGRIDGRRLFEYVKRDIENYRPRSSGYHGLPGLPDTQRDLFAAGRLEDTLTIGLNGGRKVAAAIAVCFLKRAAIKLTGRHVAGNRQEGNRVEKGIGQTNGQIRRTWTAGCKCCSRLAGHTVIHIGHETRHAFVTNRNCLNIVGTLVKCVYETDISMPAEAKSVGHLLADKIIDNHLTAVQLVVACHGNTSWFCSMLASRVCLTSG